MHALSSDAIDHLEADHTAIHGLFERYRELVRSQATALKRRVLADEICMQLTIQARLEEELFNPAVREALDDDDLVDEAEDRMEVIRDVVATLLCAPAADALRDARMATLADYAAGHVGQQRALMFNRLRASGLDVHGLGRSIRMRETELRSVADALREDAIASATA